LGRSATGQKTNVRDQKYRVVSREILKERKQHENQHADRLINLTSMICSGVDCTREVQEENYCFTLVTRVTVFHVP